MISRFNLRKLKKIDFVLLLVAPKFICERDMKKHSEKIYKSLPEVMNKKEQIKKESIKKTNLLLASIFKRVRILKLDS